MVDKPGDRSGKICSRCGLLFPIDHFSREKRFDRPGYEHRRADCRDCRRQTWLKWASASPAKKEELRAYKKNWDKEHPNYARTYGRKYRKDLREKALRRYSIGGLFVVCACCGEPESLFLNLDHIEGGGTAHRKAIGGGGDRIWKWLADNDYPSGFQVLCYNCNCGRAFNGGICPHKDPKDT